VGIRPTAKPPLTPKLTARPSAIGGWRLQAKEGEGASGTVFRATRADGTTCALKVARTAEDWVGREALILARAQRRWGPALLGAGRLANDAVGPGGEALAAGASWMATTWIEGEATRTTSGGRSPRSSLMVWDAGSTSSIVEVSATET